MLSIVMMLFCVWGYTQELPTIIPPSPEATSLAKFTEVPVNHYSGLPNINIPIYTIQEKGMTIPINLSYHARGVQVAEIAPRVGLGWGLNYGGSISRQIRGKADEFVKGYLRENFYDTFFTDSATRTILYNQDVNRTPYDYVPDVFYFNANGINGKFIFDQKTKQPLLQEFKDFSVTYSLDNSDEEDRISSFIVTDKDGNKFYYGVSEDGLRKARNYDEIIHSMVKSEPGAITYLPNESVYSYNAWQLMDIVTSLGAKIKFFYEKEESIFYRRSYDSYKKENNEGPKILKSFFTKNRSNQYLIKKIEFSSGKIEFEKSINERQDVEDAFTLDTIKILDSNDEIIKKYHFNYIYTTDNSPDNVLETLYNGDPKAKNRLFLSSITESGSEGNILPEYSFVYSNIKLPNRHSNSQDIWGYYNGADNGRFLTFFDYSSTNPINRRVDTIKSEAGLLKKIKYPTGGYTEYLFEHNKVIAGNLKDIVHNTINPLTKLTNGLSNLESQYYNGIEYSKSIVIGENIKGKVDIKTWFTDEQNCSSTGYLPDCKFEVSIHNKDKREAYPIYIGSAILNLSPGNYLLKVKPKNHVHDPYNINHGFNVIMSWEEQEISDDDLIYGEGKRIKRIDFKDSNDIVKTKEYEYLTPEGNCSGVLFGLPGFYAKDDVGIGLVMYGSIPGGELAIAYGNSLGYSHVVEYIGNKNNNMGKVEYEFTTFQNAGNYYKFPYTVPVDNEWIRGKNISLKYLKKTGNNYLLIKKIENEYSYGGSLTPSYFTGTPLLHDPPVNERLTERTRFLLPLIVFTDTYANYKVYFQSGGTLDLLNTKETNYFDYGNTFTITDYYYNYDKHYQLKSSKKTKSNGDVILNRIIYPQDKSNLLLTTAEEGLKSFHRFLPIETYMYKDIDKNGKGTSSELLSSQYTSYELFNNLYLPSKIQTSKGTQALEDRIIYHSYDSKGNPTEVSKADGTHIVYIWGYNQTQPVAIIENAKLSDIPNTYINPIRNASNLDDDRTIDSRDNNGSVTNYIGNEGQLRFYLNKLHQLTALENSQMTFYTYDPLIGVTSITDPRGQTVYYQYDEFNRLEFIKDADGNLLKEHKYHYKN
ncbi:RHS repeat protein [Tenacibaculum sp. LAR 2:5]|uniref:RHS repeat protein n=2 Tax=Tenacibaculum larymnensis TaxID=2878201 RepID=A0A9X4IMW6_9FLAO|nr:RHS repeat protein [Tenacibaculum larymnensis]